VHKSLLQPTTTMLALKLYLIMPFTQPTLFSLPKQPNSKPAAPYSSMLKQPN